MLLINKQTERQTYKQINANENITSFTKEETIYDLNILQRAI